VESPPALNAAIILSRESAARGEMLEWVLRDKRRRRD